MENKSLGKGLAALIPKKNTVIEETKENNFHSENNAKENTDENSLTKVNFLKVVDIQHNRFQPRKDYDEGRLAELKASIKEKGVLQPILVRPAGNSYEVVAGERRLRAAKAIGLQEIPVVIKNITDREALVLALVENIQRQELNAIEEAQGFKRLIEEFNFTQESVAESVGKERSTITNILRLLKLPKEIQDSVAKGTISVGHARPLLSIEDVKVQKKLVEHIAAKGLSVRQVEAQVKKILEEAGGLKRVKKDDIKNRDIQILEEELQRTVGTKVLVENKNNKGRLIIEYYSLEDFDRILGILRK